MHTKLRSLTALTSVILALSMLAACSPAILAVHHPWEGTSEDEPTIMRNKPFKITVWPATIADDQDRIEHKVEITNTSDSELKDLEILVTGKSDLSQFTSTGTTLNPPFEVTLAPQDTAVEGEAHTVQSGFEAVALDGFAQLRQEGTLDTFVAAAQEITVHLRWKDRREEYTITVPILDPDGRLVDNP
ncbi:hypothetical protein ACFSYH_06135 [Populibacterium corticicola]|uniref:Late embryogenesis abundant protein LEA-2 subgroup domain-containing protein n=1 Tax=Populibacterium corticicola TaxID=1812826 RepID=A0ABW5XFY5_9MICO